MGIALALAGADVLLTDLPHVTPLARDNVSANCRSPPTRAQAGCLLRGLIEHHRSAVLDSSHLPCCRQCHGPPQVVDYAWGSHVALLGEPPDLITGADIVYQKECFPQLVQTLEEASAPHTVIYLAFRLRGTAGVCLSRP